MSEDIHDQRSVSGNALPMPVNSLKLSTIRNPLYSDVEGDLDDNQRPINNQRQTNVNTALSTATSSSANKIFATNKTLYPFQITACSLLYAWVYTILPTENFWIYNCVKQQLWAFLCLAAYIELQEICLPDIPDSLYILCYFVGFWTPIVFNIIAFEISPQVYTEIEILAVTSGITIVVILYGIHTIYRPHGEYYGQESKFRSDEILQNYQQASESWLTIVMQNDLTGTLYDTFAVACDKSSTQSLPSTDSITLVDSDGRKNWQNVSRTFMKLHLQEEKKHLQAEADKNIENLYYEPPRFHWDVFAVFQYFCRFLPRYQFRKLKVPVGIVFGDRRAQWFYVSLYNCLFNGFFYFLALFTDYFLSAKNQNIIVLFFYFIVGASVLRGALKRTALVLERRKLGSISMYFIAEFMGSMFYYTYYRLLFESISYVWEFVLFQVMHLLSEWIMYPIRYSRPVVTWMLWLQGNDPDPAHSDITEQSGKLCQLSLIPKRVNYDDLQQFVALDFGLRILVMISTAFGVLVMTLTIDYCWWIDNELAQSGEDIITNSVYLCVAIVLEIINAAIINELFFKPQNLSIWKKTLQFFTTSPRTALLAWILAAILFINPIYSFTKGNSFS